MKKHHEHCPGDRYRYDFGLCSSENGWAQVDTDQDAWYYGHWANPEKLLIFGYFEGDTCLTECESPAEFVAELRAMDEVQREYGNRGARIDPGLDPRLKAAFESLGLSDLLH